VRLAHSRADKVVTLTTYYVLNDGTAKPNAQFAFFFLFTIESD
jgi:hypothetical protein